MINKCVYVERGLILKVVSTSRNLIDYYSYAKRELVLSIIKREVSMVQMVILLYGIQQNVTIRL